MRNKPLQIIKILKRAYPHARIELRYRSPLDLLVATILSAQCTDKRVNIVTSELFKKYKTAKDYAKASRPKFEKEIRSTGFFRNKARNIINSAKVILKDFKGRVPDSMENLLTLPGVARKTATVILFNAFHKIEGITVDTHVIRLSQRLGLSRNKNAVKIEHDLMAIVPKPLWGSFSCLIIAHGRNICIARRPICSKCVLKKICPAYPFSPSQ